MVDRAHSVSDSLRLAQKKKISCVGYVHTATSESVFNLSSLVCPIHVHILHPWNISVYSLLIILGFLTSHKEVVAWKGAKVQFSQAQSVSAQGTRTIDTVTDTPL